jgi:flagellar capping protein FliD
MSLNELITAVNAVTDVDVKASLELVVGSTDTYQMKLLGKTKGVAINFAGAVGTSSSLQTLSGLQLPTTNTVKATLQAEFEFDGLTMLRNSNLVDNILPGVTVSLNAVSSKDTVFNIGYAKVKAFTAIKEFVTAYNDLVTAVDKQSLELADGKPSPDAVLHGDPLLTKISMLLTRIRDMPLGVSDGSKNSDDPNNSISLDYLGMTFDNTFDPKTNKDGKLSNLIKLNESVLSDAILQKDYQRIIKFFGDFSESTNANLMTFSMPDSLSSTLAGNPFSVDYRYVGATGGDDNYNANFTMGVPTKALEQFKITTEDPATKKNVTTAYHVAGEKVTITYSQNEDGTFSAKFNGITGQQGDVLVSNIVDGIITLPENSIFEGLNFQFTGTAPEVGTPLVATVVLPEYVATLTMEGQTDVVVHHVYDSLIEGPAKSIYEGVSIAYQANKTSPLVMDGPSVDTTITLSQGIAKGFAKVLGDAIVQHADQQEAVSLFDLAVESLLSKNKDNEKRIEGYMDEAKFKRSQLEPLIGKLYAQSNKTSQILQLVEMMTNMGRKN